MNGFANPANKESPLIRVFNAHTSALDQFTLFGYRGWFLRIPHSVTLGTYKKEDPPWSASERGVAGAVELNYIAQYRESPVFH